MKSISRRLSLSCVFVFLCLVTLSVQVFSQNLDNVTISGKVVDSNNAPIAGAVKPATSLPVLKERIDDTLKMLQ